MFIVREILVPILWHADVNFSLKIVDLEFFLSLDTEKKNKKNHNKRYKTQTDLIRRCI